MSINRMDLIQKAKKILSENFRDGFTIPTDGLYPFQWNWDSGFISIGLSNYDIDAAISEIHSLLKGQWENGMIPHIIFHSENETSYFPNWDFWDAAVNLGVPESPKTSGITQPPVLGFVLEWIFNKYPNNKKVLDFIKEMYPKIVKNHQFWYEFRDPYQEGLVFIYHPWESGRDNSPLWDDALNSIEIDKAKLPTYQRRDTTIAEASERPTNKQYDQYIYLMQLGKKHKYEGRGIVDECEFLIQDSLVNAVLIRSNESLIKLGNMLGKDVGRLEEWQQQSINSYEAKLWNEDLGIYTGYDLRRKKQLPYREIGGLTPLFANIPSTDRANKLKSYLETLVNNEYMLVPSFDVEHELYDSKRYWRGPVWPQMNWMIFHGLNRYGFADLAAIVKSNLITLASEHEFHEYFEAQKHLLDTNHGGYGGDKFSWTASSVIDLILSK